ncbi:peptidoglycan DD-metalloendopeptidase family protein [Cytobacillus kochii]|uniref:M23 family metallopeptidase n=1 Tax=Cytobacillus TaxID=2675230 RepID=UPI001CD815BE|nr:M23 family metallopeptidase [Cytobacillus kochii]MCA1026329.1 peptidoglycan DD-metalloendopeptidase family protein [Cytobacillus kochii]MDM5209552.1 peptidoglycan DD-metalloendopeptidase family protein [Cytobacillus kochii]
MREEEKKTSQDSSFKKFMKKRWAYPAIYIASAALILSGVLWFQNSNENASDTDGFDYGETDLTGKGNEDAVEVNNAMENFVLPVEKADGAVIQTKFYDVHGEEAAQEEALVFYNNTYQPNAGIDIVMEDGKTFEVRAALSGTVTKVEEDATLGNVVEIQHAEGIVTRYQSITDMKVKEGSVVEQGDTIAQSGQSQINQEAGEHVHFEIRKDGVAVNPEEFVGKTLSQLEKAEIAEESTPAEDAAQEGSTESADDESDAAPSDEGQSEDDGASNEDETDADASSDTQES